ncbi:MAG: glycosyltransferase family 2 protein [Planctomycetota bacterium]|nr:glycosyltransferase family 2 protein [Planctomycetota bacterium]MDP6741215.1 glycosyltransferase family 2 protein [Planctomycetota bacterium]MDP6938298.1 glycosyltransferase family 2 protein [Planctomycetota bacterium]
MCPFPASTPAEAGPPVAVSVVVPVYNEEQSLELLQGEIVEALEGAGVDRVPSFEVVYVDDRSSDHSFAVLTRMRLADPRVRVVRLARNYGQSPAMAAGFEVSRGAIVVTLDGDLQNDPRDIPALIERLEAGSDLVVGWRKDRQDGFLLRRLPSILANKLIALVTGANVHDTGCTLKAFRRELVTNLPIYAEQHRFLPVLAQASGARLDEVVVHHRPRIYGQSKYGLSRAMRVLLDLLSVKMVSSFSRSPLQYFGLLALPFLALALVFAVRTGLQVGHVDFASNWGQAALLVYILTIMAGAFFVMLGLLAELVVKVSGLHGDRVFAPLERHGRLKGGAR